MVGNRARGYNAAMDVSRLRLTALILAGLLCGGGALADDKKPADQPPNEITGKVPHDYIAIPRISVPVIDEDTKIYRELQVELWVYAATPEALTKLNTTKTLIADDIKAELKKNSVQTFLAPDDGPGVIKDAAKAAIEKYDGKDAIADVLIKSMLLR